jgi:hypothetical protein
MVHGSLRRGKQVIPCDVAPSAEPTGRIIHRPGCVPLQVAADVRVLNDERSEGATGLEVLGKQDPGTRSSSGDDDERV